MIGAHTAGLHLVGHQLPLPVVDEHERAIARAHQRGGPQRQLVHPAATVGQAVAVVRRPALYLRTVAFWQACDWMFRLVAIWFLLDAFDIRIEHHDRHLKL